MIDGNLCEFTAQFFSITYGKLRSEMETIHSSLSNSAQENKKCERNTTLRHASGALLKTRQAKTPQRQAACPWPPPTPLGKEDNM